MAAPPPAVIDKGSVSWKWFMTFLDDGTIDATEEDLLFYLTDQLKVKMEQLDEGLAVCLPVMLVAFMKTWSGWHFLQQYKDGKFSLDTYFSRFQKFLAYKINQCIKTGYSVALRDIKRDQAMGISGDDSGDDSVVLTNTPPLDADGNPPPADPNDPIFAPYSLLIKCPPQMINTIVFTNVEDDVILKHHLGKNWKPLNTIQLITWPNIRVTFVNEDLFFIRTQATDYKRYLNFLPHDCKKSEDHVVEYMETTGGLKTTRTCYTYRLLEAYVREYINALKTMKNLNPDKLEEIETILMQFLEDIRFIDQKETIANNTRILFRLTQASFIRNKKLLKGGTADQDPTRVGYCEVITPKVELLLKHFKGEQRKTKDVKFESTERMKSFFASLMPSLKLILPKIYYKCNFCNKDFVSFHSRKEVLEHLDKEHKMEQPVRCTHCKKQFDVLSLTTCRWRHKCDP